jgi:hypothetical protein
MLGIVKAVTEVSRYDFAVWRHVFWKERIDFSEERTASMFRVDEWKKSISS